MSKIERLKSVNKAISVLNCFNLNNLELTTSAISKMVGLHRATVHRLLETLSNAGYVERSETTGKYSVGPTLYSMGMLYLNAKDTLKVSEPVVKALNDMTGEVVTVGILHQDYYINIMREESKHTVRLSYSVGSRFPAHATATGKSLLSELTEDEIDRIYPKEELESLTSKTIATKTQLKKELELIKKTGVAINKEELREGVWAVSSIMRDSTDMCVGSLGIAVPTIRIDDTKLECFATLVIMGAKFISYRLGNIHLVEPVTKMEDIYLWWEQNKTTNNQIRSSVMNKH